MDKILPFILDTGSHLAVKPVNYKYYDAETALSALKDQTIQFSHHSEFNDPFDNTVYFYKIDKNTSDEYFNKVSINNPNLPTIKKNYLALENPDQYLKNTLEKENSDRGITCFSKEFNQMQMWAFYSKNHTGICIGYNLRELREKISNHYECIALTVNYVNKLTQDCKLANDESIINRFITKHHSWKYENEIRIISRPFVWNSNNEKKKLINLPPELIKEVYFGYAISNKDAEETIKVLKTKYPHVKLYKIRANYEEFELQCEEITY